MLAVGIEGHDHVCAFRKRKRDSGLQPGSLPQIDRMAHDDGAGRERRPAGPVGRAVVDDDGAISGAADVGDDARDHRRLVVGGDHDPYWRIVGCHRFIPL